MWAMQMALKWSKGYTLPRLEIGSREEMPQAPSPGDGKRDYTMVPVFSVTPAEDGSIRSLNQGNNVSVDESTLDSVVAEVLTLAGDAGGLSSYDLRYLRETDSAGIIRIAFADRRWESGSIGQLILICLVVGLLELAGFFLISLPGQPLPAPGGKSLAAAAVRGRRLPRTQDPHRCHLGQYGHCSGTPAGLGGGSGQVDHLLESVAFEKGVSLRTCDLRTHASGG